MKPRVKQLPDKCANEECRNRLGEGRFTEVSWDRTIITPERLPEPQRATGQRNASAIRLALCGPCQLALMDHLALPDPKPIVREDDDDNK